MNDFRKITEGEAVERVVGIVRGHPGLNFQALDRSAKVWEFPDGLKLSDLVARLLDAGVIESDSSGQGFFFSADSEI